MEIRPVGLPLLRDDLIAFAATDAAVRLREVDVENGHLHYDRPRTVAAMASLWVEAEAEALHEAELFHVSPEMSELAGTAARSLPDFRLAAEDAPSPYGLAWFAKPIEEIGVSGASFPVVAISWAMTSGAIMLTTYCERDAYHQFRGGSLPPVFPLGCFMTEIPSESPLLFQSAPDGAEYVYADAVASGAPGAIHIAVLKSTWLLMSQPLASVEDAKYDRAARRRIQRQGKQPPRVRVITLRRPASSGSSAESDREWHHRWIVRGHWRQQWYPARQVHRPVWIAPHVKGPEGKPMLGGEKVYALRK